MHSTVQPLAAARAEALRALIEREDEADAIYTALVARAHILLVGPPGTAKSYAARTAAATLTGCRYVERLLSPTTPPEAIFGPVSLSALRADRYEHVTTGTVADAELVFLDEVGRASPAILDTLLHLLGPERQALIGTVQVHAPLVTAIGAANTWPEDAAFLDRWLIRRVVRPISRAARTRLMYERLPVPQAVASITDLEAAQGIAAQLPISTDAQAAYAEILDRLNGAGITPSDRRLRASVSVARAAALLGGREQVTPRDLYTLGAVLWNRPEEAEQAAQLVAEVAHPTMARLSLLLAQADEQKDAADATDDAAVRISAIQKLTDMAKEAKAIVAADPSGNGRAAAIVAYIQQTAVALQAKQLGLDPAKAAALLGATA